MKNQKGITLIALVITIIVLLILAGISIAMLTGDNGILSKASQAGENTREGTIKEALSLASSSIMADIIDRTSTTAKPEWNYATVAKYVKNDNASSNAQEYSSSSDPDGITYDYNNKTYNVTFKWLYKDGDEQPENIIGIDVSTVKIVEAAE